MAGNEAMCLEPRRREKRKQKTLKTNQKSGNRASEAGCVLRQLDPITEWAESSPPKRVRRRHTANVDHVGVFGWGMKNMAKISCGASYLPV